MDYPFVKKTKCFDSSEMKEDNVNSLTWRQMTILCKIHSEGLYKLEDEPWFLVAMTEDKIVGTNDNHTAFF